MQIAFLVLMFVLGATFGSFLCCQARRLRVREERSSQNPKLARPQHLGTRSICLHCHRHLKWYDNLPIISYLVLRGKCRYCHRKIGRLELLSELGVATAFALITARFLYTAHAIPITDPAIFPTIPLLNWAIFATTLLLTLSLAFLAIYDGAYGELPSFCLILAAICAIALVILRQQTSHTVPNTLTLFPGTPLSPTLSALLSATLFGGLYLVLYLASKGKWVGDGDWFLAGIIGLVLGHPFLALIAIFIANLSATLLSAPSAIKRKNHQIYFGPYLVLAFVITATFSDFFISMI